MLMVGCQHLVQHSVSGAQQEGCSKMTRSTPLWQKSDCEGMKDEKLGISHPASSFEESQAEEDIPPLISTSLKRDTRYEAASTSPREPPNGTLSRAIGNANLHLR